MSNFTVKNNFKAFKNDFKTDTGLDADKHMVEYIQYANFRINDQNIQQSAHLLNQILNELGWLPSKLSPAIFDILKEYKKLK